MPPPTGPFAMLWPWILTFDPINDTFIFVPKCINAESLVKFSPVIVKILCQHSQKGIFQHVGHHRAFWPKSWSVHPCPKMHQCWKSGVNMSNVFEDIVLTTLFGTHRLTDSQTAGIYNVSGCTKKTQQTLQDNRTRHRRPKWLGHVLHVTSQKRACQWHPN